MGKNGCTAISLKSNQLVAVRIISHFGIFVKPQYNLLVSKAIPTARQECLRAVLRQVRVDAGLTQVDLARRLGQPQSFVSKYECGERRLDLVEVREICSAVGVSLVELVRRFEESLL